MIRRSFRVSEDFINKLEFIQTQSRLDLLPKTQEQIFDEMINLYLLYKCEDKDLFITEEMQKQLNNSNELFIKKQAQLINALIDHIDKKIDEMT